MSDLSMRLQRVGHDLVTEQQRKQQDILLPHVELAVAQWPRWAGGSGFTHAPGASVDGQYWTQL